MNSIVLVGNLTKDPESRVTPNNKDVTTFTVAVPRGFSDETDFINIVTWNKVAKNCGQYLAKGSKVALQGTLQIRNYNDQEGNKRYITEVVASNVEFLSKPKERDPDLDESSPFDNEQDEFAADMQQIELDDEELPF